MEVADQFAFRALDWNGEHTRCDCKNCWFAHLDESEERADGGQARISRADTVGPLLFDIVEECQDGGRIEIGDRESFWLDALGLVDESQEQA